MSLTPRGLASTAAHTVFSPAVAGQRREYDFTRFAL
jgi:hypothetical protein